MNQPGRDRRTFKSVVQRLGLFSGAVVLAISPVFFMLGLALLEELAFPALESRVSIVMLLGLLPLGLGLALTVGPALVALLLLIFATKAGRLPHMLGLTLLFMVLGYGGAHSARLINTALQDKALREQAEQGDIDAQLALGKLSLENIEGYGKFVPACTEATYWFEVAAYRGNAEAQYQLGVTYDRCVPSYVNVPVHAWFQIAAGNPEATDGILEMIERHYRSFGHGLAVDEFVATERIIDQVEPLFADPALAPDQRRAAVEQLLEPLIENAINEKTLWGLRTVNPPVKTLHGWPGADILATPETEAAGIAGERAELFGVVTLPLDSRHAHIPVLSDPASGNAVGIALPLTRASWSPLDDIEREPTSDLAIGWQLYFLPPESLQLESYAPHTVIYLLDISQPEESRPDRYWYRTENGEWKQVPADSGDHWNQAWADRMESDAVSVGDPLIP